MNSPQPAESGKKILIFAPEAGVAPHFVSLCILARTLKELGHDVLFVRCHAIFPRCPVMDMYLLPFRPGKENQAKACPTCLGTSTRLLEAYGLDAVDLHSFLTPGLLARVVESMQASGDNLADFVFDGIPFGKMCIQDLVLATKVCNLANLSEEARFSWSQYISSAVLSYLLAAELLGNIPVSHVFYHNDYSNLVAARLAAGRKGIPVCTIGFSAHLTQDRRQYNIQPTTNFGSAFQCTASWPKYRELSLPAKTVVQATDDILMRLGAKGGFVYSPAKTFGNSDLHGRLGMAREKTLLVAFTSSLDELQSSRAMKEALNLPVAGPEQPFKDQIQWLKALVALSDSRADINLVVRIHPREGANKREAVVSQHLHILKAEFDRPMANCRFIWPEDTLSSYDLGEAADVVLTSWSTIGIDLARLAVPVLHSNYGASPWPNDDFQQWAETEEGYFRKLEDLIRQPAAFEPLLHAYRWYHLYVLGRSVDFSDVVPTRDFAEMPGFRMPAEAGLLERCTLGGEDIQEINLARLLRDQSDSSAAEEEEEVKQQLRRIIHFLCTGEDGGPDFRLIAAVVRMEPVEFTRTLGLASLPPSWAFLVIRGNSICYSRGGLIHPKHSPMVRRLAQLSCHYLFCPEDPVPDKTLVLTRPEELVAVLREPVAGKPFAVHSAIAEIVRLRDANRLKEAREAATVHTAAYPGCPDLLNLSAHLEAMQGNLDGALEAFSAIARKWPRFGKTRNNLSALLWEKGDTEGALENLSQALKVDPLNGDYVLNAMRIYRKLGREGDVESLGAAYLKAKPGDDRVRQAYAEISSAART